MSYPTWVTPAGNLGLIPENEYYSLALSAYNTGDGTGAVAVVQTVINRAPYGKKDEGIVTAIKIVKGGSKYTTNFVNVSISGGTGFVGIARVVNGSIAEIIIDDGGYGYSVEQSVITFNRNLEFSKISGDFPPGIYVTKSGSLQGVPVVIDTDNVNKTYKFTIRAKNITTQQVADRTFTMGISNILPPKIYQTQTYLGNYFDGTFFELALKVIGEANPNATVTWSIESGSLPNGLTLSDDGVISGFIMPLLPEGNPGQTAYANMPYDELGYDNSPRYQNSNYQFTVQLYDGISFATQVYQMKVTAKGNWLADTMLSQVNNSIINVDYLTGTQLTADATNKYAPIIITPPQSLPSVRADSNFAFKFEGYDPSYSGNGINWRISDLSESGFDQNTFDITNFDQQASLAPLYLSIDPITGWLTGHVASQVETTKTYSFEVVAYRPEDISVQSVPVRYTVTVYRDVGDYINWATDSDLGLIDNGAISQLKIEATAHIFTNGVDFPNTPTYSLVNLGSNLPNGLKLLKDGLIIGRASFEYFAIDLGSTPLDDDATIFDNLYEFTVKATYQSISDTRKFKLLANNYNKIPYENLYIKALPRFEERVMFSEIVNNREIFPRELIYRFNDPWFGLARDIRSIFLAGLYPSQMSEYMRALSTNHFTKKINFGKIKTARALDSNFNIKYEVVYIELDDPVTDQGRSPAQSMTLFNNNSWIDPEGNDGYTTYYPNSFDNMKYTLTQDIGFAYQATQANAGLPEWMTSTQEDKTVIGFVHALVLAYTVPGASKLIAYRLQTAGLEFNRIDFVIDRYNLDNILSYNYDIAANKFITSNETTFDRINRVGQAEHSVNYAVRNIPFQEINNQTIEYIRNLGGLDGATDFNDGDLLVFAQQELYYNYLQLPNDGWNQIVNNISIPVPGHLNRVYNTKIQILVEPAVIGQDYIVINDTAGIKIGYIVESGLAFAPATTVKSINGNKVYLENRFKSAIGPIALALPAGTNVSFAPINYRAGIWKIKIVDEIDSNIFTPVDASDFGSDTIGFDTRTYDRSIEWIDSPPAPTQIVTLEFYSPVELEGHVQVNNGTSFSQRLIYFDPLLKLNHSVPEYSIVPTDLRQSDQYTRFDTYRTKFIKHRDTFSSPESGDKYLKFPKTGVFK